MHSRHQQLKQLRALEHYEPPLVFPGKGAMMRWWLAEEALITERGEELAEYYERLICGATLETLEALGTCWAPGYTLHEVAPRGAAEPADSGRLPAVASHLEEGESAGADQGGAEAQSQLGDDDVGRSPPPERSQPDEPSKANTAAWWWIGLLVLLVAIMLGGAVTLNPTAAGAITGHDSLPVGQLPSRSQLDDVRTNLQEVQAGRANPTGIAEVERAQKLQALLEMRRAKLSAAEEEQHRLQEAEKEREKQRAAYEASVLRRRAAGKQLTRAQQQHVPSSRGEPLEETAATDAPKRPIVTTKHGCTCLPSTVDLSDPSAPAEWDGCASRAPNGVALTPRANFLLRLLAAG